MKNFRFEIDCTKNGLTGTNNTGESLSSLKPYLYGIDITGQNDIIGTDDPEDANFQVTEMTDVRLVEDEDDFGNPAVTIFFKAVIEFNLEFESDYGYGGGHYKKLLEENNWTVKLSSDTMGLQTSDGKMDDDSFDGYWPGVSIVLINGKT